MKCVIALAVLAVALPAAFGAPRPGFLAGTTLIKSADYLDGEVISAPATVAIAPSAFSSQSTVIAHPAPALTYTHAAPLAYSLPVVAAAPSLVPAGKTTVVAGPSGTITQTQGLSALAYNAW